MELKDNNLITIYSLKYDGRVNYEWNAKLLTKTDSYIITAAPPGTQLIHYGKDKIFTFESYVIEFFPLNKWFTVSLTVKNGIIVKYYCNICMPPVLNGNKLSFLDLDLDYINFKGYWEVVDEDDFQINQVKYNYPHDLIIQTREALDRLIRKIQHNHSPFDGFFSKLVADMFPA